MKKTFYFLFIVLFLQLFTACNSVDSKQFITQDIHNQLQKKCETKSFQPARCEWAHYEKNILEYCEKNKLSDSQCDQIKSDVMKVLKGYFEKEDKAFKELKEGFERDMYTR